jgi:hypothetical protein
MAIIATPPTAAPAMAPTFKLLPPPEDEVLDEVTVGEAVGELAAEEVEVEPINAPGLISGVSRKGRCEAAKEPNEWRVHTTSGL